VLRVVVLSLQYTGFAVACTPVVLPVMSDARR